MEKWAENSFSKVVLEQVPKRGTFADFSREIDKLPPLTEEQANIMKDVVAKANDWKNYPDPWTTS